MPLSGLINTSNAKNAIAGSKLAEAIRKLYSRSIRFAIFCASGSPRRSAHKIHNFHGFAGEIIQVRRNCARRARFRSWDLSERSSARPPAERNIVPLASIAVIGDGQQPFRSKVQGSQDIVTLATGIGFDEATHFAVDVAGEVAAHNKVGRIHE